MIKKVLAIMTVGFLGAAGIMSLVHTADKATEPLVAEKVNVEAAEAKLMEQTKNNSVFVPQEDAELNFLVASKPEKKDKEDKKEEKN